VCVSVGVGCVCVRESLSGYKLTRVEWESSVCFHVCTGLGVAKEKNVKGVIYLTFADMYRGKELYVDDSVLGILF
jgi:hypothetical protein